MDAAELRALAERATRNIVLPANVRMIVLLVDPDTSEVGWVAQLDTRETMLVLQQVLFTNAN